MEALPSEELQIPKEQRGLLAVLPLMYIAWADGIMTPSEIEEIGDRIERLPWFSEADRETLAAWMDPQNPPSTALYQRWLSTMRRASKHIPKAADKSLAELGLEMARLVGEPAVHPEGAEALHEIEDVLGIVGHEASRELLEDRPEAPTADEAASLDVAALVAMLDGPQAALRKKVRTLLSDPVFRLDADMNLAAFRERVLYWLQLLADQGLGALAYPEAHGGAEDFEQFLVAFETLGYGDLSLVIKYGVQFGLFGGSVHQLGTEKHHAKYLADIGSLKLPGCFAMTELGHGSNVRELLTTARYDAERDGFVINTPSDFARKEYIGNAARHGQMATVFAQLSINEEEYGVHAFLVPIRDAQGNPRPRIRIDDCGHKMGLNGVDNGRLWFDNVFVPRDNLLDRFAQVDADGNYHSSIPSAGKRFFTMLSTLVGGRISIAAAGLSASKVGLTIAIRYGAQRRQFGPKGEAEVPILDYLTHQRRLFPLLANVYAFHFSVNDLQQRFAHDRADEEKRQEMEGLAAGLKALASWNTTHTLQTCREACGGQGYLSVNRLALLKADTDIFTTFEGDNTVLLLQVAKGLLSDYRQQFQDMNAFGMVKYVADEAVDRLLDRLPLVRRLTETSGNLRDAEFQLSAFQHREQDLIRSAARRIKGRIDAGMDSYRAFMEVQDHLITMARAHVLRQVLEQFSTSISTSPSIVQPVLKMLADLFALWHLEQDRAWFLEHGYFSSSQSEAIRAEVNTLCAELRPYAVGLVNAFAIPDAVLEAPIALTKSM